MSVLSRGYGAIFNSDNKIVKSIDDVSIDDEMLVKLSNGSITAKVISKEGNKNGKKRNGI